MVHKPLQSRTVTVVRKTRSNRKRLIDEISIERETDNAALVNR